MENIFRGIIYCSECGYHLSMAHKRSGIAFYRCMNHYRHPENCLHTHAVHYDDLYEAVLERIQSTAKLFQNDKAFYALVAKRAGVDNSSEQLAESRNKLKKRHSELSSFYASCLRITPPD
ncbi:MAG: zinc ribbon domain-containing protein [Eubacteriales bacterium]